MAPRVSGWMLPRRDTRVREGVVAVDTCFADLVMGQLAGAGRLHCRAMFGGYALYCGSDFFGMISGDRLYLKTDAATVCHYVGRGMAPFRDARQESLRTYYGVPPDVVRDRARLTEWVRAAIRCAAGSPHQLLSPRAFATPPPGHFVATGEGNR